MQWQIFSQCHGINNPSPLTMMVSRKKRRKNNGLMNKEGRWKKSNEQKWVYRSYLWNT